MYFKYVILLGDREKAMSVFSKPLHEFAQIISMDQTMKKLSSSESIADHVKKNNELDIEVVGYSDDFDGVNKLIDARPYSFQNLFDPIQDSRRSRMCVSVVIIRSELYGVFKKDGITTSFYEAINAARAGFPNDVVISEENLVGRDLNLLCASEGKWRDLSSEVYLPGLLGYDNYFVDELANLHPDAKFIHRGNTMLIFGEKRTAIIDPDTPFTVYKRKL